MRDLTGQRFGKLVALEDTGRRSRGLVVWRCQCDCGNTCEVVGPSLTKGNTRSCGCLKSGLARDVAGRRFGRLVAVEPTGKRDRGSVVWRCRCDCGNECEATATALRLGRKVSCGCAVRGAGARNARDIAGQRFGKLVAVAPTGGRHRGSVVWECRCDCGNTCEAPLSALTSGHKSSCGCVLGGEGGRSVKLDLAGRRFGRLVAVRATDRRKGGSVVWECVCDCGNSCDATAAQLVNGRKKSCGCLRGKPAAAAGAAGSVAVAGPAGGGAVAAVAGPAGGSGAAVPDAGAPASAAAGAFTSTPASTATSTATQDPVLAASPSSAIPDVPSNVRDLRGEKFGDLTPVRVVGRQGTHAVWECVCDCGSICRAASGNLSSGRTASCGCRRGGRDKSNLAGRRFGRLVAVNATGEDLPVEGGGASPEWRCLCDCNRVVRASARDLALGNVTACSECDLPGERDA